MKLKILVVLLSASLSAQADVYKCVVGFATKYQSKPCESGESARPVKIESRTAEEEAKSVTLLHQYEKENAAHRAREKKEQAEQLEARRKQLQIMNLSNQLRRSTPMVPAPASNYNYRPVYWGVPLVADRFGANHINSEHLQGIQNHGRHGQFDRNMR